MPRSQHSLPCAGMQGVGGGDDDGFGLDPVQHLLGSSEPGARRPDRKRRDPPPDRPPPPVRPACGAARMVWICRLPIRPAPSTAMRKGFMASSPGHARSHSAPRRRQQPRAWASGSWPGGSGTSRLATQSGGIASSKLVQRQCAFARRQAVGARFRISASRPTGALQRARRTIAHNPAGQDAPAQISSASPARTQCSASTSTRRLGAAAASTTASAGLQRSDAGKHHIFQVQRQPERRCQIAPVRPATPQARAMILACRRPASSALRPRRRRLPSAADSPAGLVRSFRRMISTSQTLNPASAAWAPVRGQSRQLAAVIDRIGGRGGRQPQIHQVESGRRPQSAPFVPAGFRSG